MPESVYQRGVAKVKKEVARRSSGEAGERPVDPIYRRSVDLVLKGAPGVSVTWDKSKGRHHFHGSGMTEKRLIQLNDQVKRFMRRSQTQAADEATR